MNKLSDDGIVVGVAWVYILRCGDGSLYVGLTEDLLGRVDAHTQGHACSFTATRMPVLLVYSEEYHSIVEARMRERQLKHWSRAKKEALIVGDIDRLKSLSRCRSSGRTS